MDRFITDHYIRRAAQIVLLSLLAALCVLLFLTALAMIWKLLGKLEDANLDLATLFFTAMSYPFRESLAPFAVVGLSALPIGISVVCFTIDLSVNPPKATAALNRIGHFALLLLSIGMLLGAAALMLFAAPGEEIQALVGGAENQAAVKGLVSTFVTFQAVFFTHLFGLAPK